MNSIKVRQRHLYVPDPAIPPDALGNQPCVCGLARKNDRHQLPATDPAVTKAEARRLGESE